MGNIGTSIEKFLDKTGIAQLAALDDWWKYLIMYAIVGVLFYLAIVYLLTFAIKLIERRLRAGDKR